MDLNMPKPIKTGVLVHGCNLHAENWRYVAWGDPPASLGRIPQGIVTALELEASVIVFGTGASKKVFRLGETEKTGVELAEAEYSLEFLRSHFSQLYQFAPLRSLMEELASENDLLDRIRLDLESRNTVEEIRNAGKIFAEHEIDRVVLVSSPSHIVRCLRDAGDVYWNDDQFVRFRHRVYANPSTTCYEGTYPGDVVVVEPPHRPDRHVIPTHRRIQRMMMLQRLPIEKLASFVEEFDDLLQKYENEYFSCHASPPSADS